MSSVSLYLEAGRLDGLRLLVQVPDERGDAVGASVELGVVSLE